MRFAWGIVQRLPEATFVPLRRVGIGDWSPKLNFCHANVLAWVSRSPQHKHVRGFVVFDLRPLVGHWRVCAHSVVELEDGSLIDITPSAVSQLYPFIRHTGTEEEFAEFAAAIQVDVEARYVPPP